MNIKADDFQNYYYIHTKLNKIDVKWSLTQWRFYALLKDYFIGAFIMLKARCYFTIV